MAILNWYPATSADLTHDDLETDLCETGQPGGAIWAWVADEDSGWSWTIYARWLWEDIDADPDKNILAESKRSTQDEAVTAVEAWVMAHGASPSRDQEN
jgi:hypothetical protein